MKKVINTYIYSNINQIMLGRIKNTLRNIKETIVQNRVMGFIQSKNYDKMAHLLRKKENYQSLKINDFPFLFFLINNKEKEAILALLNTVNYKEAILEDSENPMTMNPISYAFLEGQYEIVEILQKSGASLKKPNPSLQNILHLSAIYKQKEAFKKAVTLNIDHNLQDEFGNTPFHYAARSGSPQMTQIMISARAKKIQNKLYQYPVHMAIQSSNLQTFDLLKNDVTIPYPKYHPIHSAARCGNNEILLNILKMKPSSLNIKDHKGLTPLHHSVTVQDCEIVKKLLKEPGILIDETDSYGNTPLHIAFMNENIDLCRILIERGANLDVLNEQNLSPADYGISSKNKQISSLLLQWRQKSKRVEQWSSSKY